MHGEKMRPTSETIEKEWNVSNPAVNLLYSEYIQKTQGEKMQSENLWTAWMDFRNLCDLINK